MVEERSATRVPAVGKEGGTDPVSLRIMTPAKFTLVGFVQESETDVVVTALTVRWVISAGAVVTAKDLLVA